jgi:hypothetical protein
MKSWERGRRRKVDASPAKERGSLGRKASRMRFSRVTVWRLARRHRTLKRGVGSRLWRKKERVWKVPLEQAILQLKKRTERRSAEEEGHSARSTEIEKGERALVRLQ